MPEAVPAPPAPLPAPAPAPAPATAPATAPVTARGTALAPARATAAESGESSEDGADVACDEAKTSASKALLKKHTLNDALASKKQGVTDKNALILRLQELSADAITRIKSQHPKYVGPTSNKNSSVFPIQFRLPDTRLKSWGLTAVICIRRV